MPKLILMRGLPGSGKSTRAKALSDYVHIEADMYFIHKGRYVFDRKRLSHAHDWCLLTTNILLNSGISVVVANTFTQQWEMAPYKALGFQTEVIVCRDNFGSIHNVPQTAIEAMKARWEE